MVMHNNAQEERAAQLQFHLLCRRLLQVVKISGAFPLGDGHPRLRDRCQRGRCTGTLHVKLSRSLLEDTGDPRSLARRHFSRILWTIVHYPRVRKLR